MSELATYAKDGTKSSSDKENYNTEFTELKSYISDIGTKTLTELVFSMVRNGRY